jgi:hypothetical protein
MADPAVDALKEQAASQMLQAQEALAQNNYAQAESLLASAKRTLSELRPLAEGWPVYADDFDEH